MNSEGHISNRGLERLAREVSEVAVATRAIDSFTDIRDISDGMAKRYAEFLGNIEDVCEIAQRYGEGTYEQTESAMKLVEEIRSILGVLYSRAEVITKILNIHERLQLAVQLESGETKSFMPIHNVSLDPLSADAKAPILKDRKKR
jgi:hypothetical protein